MTHQSNHRAFLRASVALPRAVSMLPQANATANTIAQIQNGLTEFKARHDTALDNVQAAMDDINSKIAAGRVGAVAGERIDDPEYTKAYAGWVRNGRGEEDLRIKASMSAGSSSDGGYLAPTEWDRRINKALEPISPIRRLANVIQTSVRAYSTLWTDGAVGTGWLGETASRPATSTPGLATLEFPHGELYANPQITQQLLDDAQFPLEQWLADQVSETFSKQEDIAFVAGDGVNKPRGFMTYAPGGASEAIHPGGALSVVASGAASALTADALINIAYSLAAPYRINATWVMNSITAAAVAKLKDGQGNYLWRQAFNIGEPATLLGFPIEHDENMPAIAANAFPIAFGDFKKGYVINDRFGIRVLRDPYTNKPFVGFYTTKRVGGGLADPNAIRLMKIAAS